jgi:hypothetical protein
MAKTFAIVTAALITLAAALPAQALVVVPEGNRNAEQPSVPLGSFVRTRSLKETYELKYEKVIDFLRGDERLRDKIAKVAIDYDIDPVHIAGAIVGEHTYNVDVYDRLQSYYIKAISYMTADLTFSYEGVDISDFVKRPEFNVCADKTGSYDIWVCREEVWKSSFEGKTVDGIAYPKKRLSAVFFQPFYAGQTFGIGQMNPLTALELSDLVHEKSGLPRLTVDNPNLVYKTIMDPDLTLPFVAATIRKSIDAYRDIAGFDISRNPGITATLYNLGNPEERAFALASENRRAKLAGKALRLPQENYYGWLVNNRIDDLRALFPRTVAQQN